MNFAMKSTYFISRLLGEELSSVDANKCPLRNIIKTTYSPAFVGRFEELELQLKRMLNHSVQTGTRTFTPVKIKSLNSRPFYTYKEQKMQPTCLFGLTSEHKFDSRPVKGLSQERT